MRTFIFFVLLLSFSSAFAGESFGGHLTFEQTEELNISWHAEEAHDAFARMPAEKKEAFLQSLLFESLVERLDSLKGCPVAPVAGSFCYLQRTKLDVTISDIQHY